VLLDRSVTALARIWQGSAGKIFFQVFSNQLLVHCVETREVLMQFKDKLFAGTMLLMTILLTLFILFLALSDPL